MNFNDISQYETEIIFNSYYVYAESVHCPDALEVIFDSIADQNSFNKNLRTPCEKYRHVSVDSQSVAVIPEKPLS